MRFEKYYEPTSIDECSKLLITYGTDAQILAGGTDLVPKLKSRNLKVKTIIGLNGISEAKGIKETKDGVEVGALVTLRDITKSNIIRENWKALAEAAGHVSSMQVRNIATIGGNVCNASPSADAVQGLIVSDAMVNIVGPNGRRKVPIIDFFVGPGKTILEEGELVVSFTIPNSRQKSGASYKKFAIRGDVDISIVGAGSSITLDKDDKVSHAIISLAAVAPTPIRVTDVEKLIVGKVLTKDLILEAAEKAANSCNPITDQRATKEYRIEMVKVWTKNALTEAVKRAKE